MEGDEWTARHVWSDLTGGAGTHRDFRREGKLELTTASVVERPRRREFQKDSAR